QTRDHHEQTVCQSTSHKQSTHHEPIFCVLPYHDKHHQGLTDGKLLTPWLLRSVSQNLSHSATH
ncbi:MAG: hypothetical protein MUE53_09940, partial [Chitinophagales bacterium]|nr:hypothetical protein [Chitinophagales bacterium]